MSYSDDLIAIAKSLCFSETGEPPGQAALKTAIHNSYQAVLHCLQQMCADELVGDESVVDRPINAWYEVYRALRHDALRKACGSQVLRIFPKAFQGLGRSVRNLQVARNSANYNLRSIAKVIDAIACIDMAEDCIETLELARKKDRLAFAVWIILDRSSGVNDARRVARLPNPTILSIEDKQS